ncbi:MAG TPA: glycosyltransferase [Stenomitos sp.]
MSNSEIKIQFFIYNIGDYHVARIQSLIDKFHGSVNQIQIIEIFSKSKFYQHTQNRREDLLNKYPDIITFFDIQTNQAEPSPTKILYHIVSNLFRYRPNLVITLGYDTFLSNLLLILSKIIGAKIILLSESKQDDLPRSKFKESLKKLIVSLYNAALVGGERHINYIASLGIPRNLILKGYDVVDNKYFFDKSEIAQKNIPELRLKYNLPENYILCVSRLVKRKNLTTLLNVFAKLNSSTYKLVIIGYGPEKDNLLKQCTELNICDKVMFIENVSNQDIYIYYTLASFFVLLSFSEQWGLSVNESLACGTPVIVSRSCGCVDEIVIDGYNGYVVDPYEINDIERAFISLIDSPSKRKYFSNNSRSVISKYGPSLFADNIEALSKQIMQITS